MTSEHSPQNAPDRIFAALNPLVIDGTLSAAQADRVHRNLLVQGATENVRPGATAVIGSVEPGEATAVTSADEPRERIVPGLVALGSALALVAATIAAVAASSQPDFGEKSFAVGLVVALALGAACVASQLLLHRSIRVRWIISLLGAVALASLAVLILSSWDEEALIYITGLLLIAGGVAGYLWIGEQLLSLPIVAGGLLILGQIVDDFTDDSTGGTGLTLTIGLVFVVFGAVTVAVGWRFACRHLTGMVGSGIALTAMALVTAVIGIFAPFASFGATGAVAESSFSDAVSHARIAMFIGLVVAAAVVGLYVVTGLTRYVVLAAAGAFVIVLAGLAFTAGEHPLRWAVGAGAVGLLLIAAGLAWLHRRTQAQTRPAAPVSAHAGYPGQVHP